MSFLSKFKALLGLASVQLTDGQGAAISAEKEAEIANSLEFHSLIEGEMQEVIKAQAENTKSMTAQLSDLKEKQAAFEAAIQSKIDAISAEIEALGTVAVSQHEVIQAAAPVAKVEAVESKIVKIANAINAMKGLPLVEANEEDESLNSMGAESNAGVKTIADLKNIFYNKKA
jgi:hypothetical protein